MIVLERIAARGPSVFKAVRLSALLDTPNAFGSTYARESQLTDADWVERARRWDGERAVMYLAMDGETPCGIAGAYLDQDDASRAHLISMWTAPTHRRLGVGGLLVDGIRKWASLQGGRALRLMVVSNNEAAIRFYKRLGFVLTGEAEPYPNDPALIEYEMTMPIGEKTQIDSASGT